MNSILSSSTSTIIRIPIRIINIKSFLRDHLSTSTSSGPLPSTPNLTTRLVNNHPIALSAAVATVISSYYAYTEVRVSAPVVHASVCLLDFLAILIVLISQTNKQTNKLLPARLLPRRHYARPKTQPELLLPRHPHLPTLQVLAAL